MQDVYKNKIDVIVVWALDRFARSMVHGSHLLNELHNKKVRFISITQNIDTNYSDPTRNLQLNVILAFAQFEREMIVTRVKAGIELAKRRGKKLGRPKVTIKALDEAVRMVVEDGRSVNSVMGWVRDHKFPVSKNTLIRRVNERKNVHKSESSQ